MQVNQSTGRRVYSRQNEIKWIEGLIALQQAKKTNSLVLLEPTKSALLHLFDLEFSLDRSAHVELREWERVYSADTLSCHLHHLRTNPIEDVPKLILAGIGKFYVYTHKEDVWYQSNKIENLSFCNFYFSFF